MARNGCSKEEIKEYFSREFGYDLEHTCDGIRPGYRFDVSCQGSVPEAIISERDRKKWDETVLASIGEDCFFPVFTTEEEMGEYGNGFSKVQKHIVEIIPLARNNESGVMGIVINAFNKPFAVPKELFSVIEDLNKNDD